MSDNENSTLSSQSTRLNYLCHECIQVFAIHSVQPLNPTSITCPSCHSSFVERYTLPTRHTPEASQIPNVPLLPLAFPTIRRSSLAPGDFFFSEEAFQQTLNRLFAAGLNNYDSHSSHALTVPQIDALQRIISPNDPYFLTVNLPLSASENCAICQESYFCDGKESECIKMANCTHLFHAECIIPWLLRNGSCPVCRKLVLPESPTEN